MQLDSSIDAAERGPAGLEKSVDVDATVKCNGSCTLKPDARNDGSCAHVCQQVAGCRRSRAAALLMRNAKKPG